MTHGEAPDSGNTTVLVVDDEEDILFSMQMAFGTFLPNVRLLTAASGAEGLDVLAKNTVDLLVTDFKMPGMDGVQFLEQAHRRRPGLRSMMVTAFPNEALIGRARAAGAALVIAKPLDVDVLAGAVEFAIRHPPAA